MRKIYLLLLLLCGFTGFAFSPPVITTPAPLRVCDIDNDGFATFDLTTVIPQVLGSLNPNLYAVTFHETFMDAQVSASPILNPTAYGNISPNFQVLYIRVTDNANVDDFSVTTLELGTALLPTAAINGYTTVCGGSEITVAFQGSLGSEPYTFTYSVNGGEVLTVVTPFLNAVGINLPTIASGTYDILLISVQGADSCPNTINWLHHIDVVASPTFGPAEDLSIEQIPFTGTAIFDLTANDSALISGNPNITVDYYLTQEDSFSEINPIVEPVIFSGSNGQEIFARINNEGSACAAFTSFHLYITNPDIVFIPDGNFKAKLIQLGVDTNTDGEIQITEALVVTTLDVSNSNIADLTGIESFLNVNNLNCSNNQLTDLDLNNFSVFNTLDCSNNQITSLDLNDIQFFIFKATANALTSLSMNNTIAFQFYCDENDLTTLDLTTASITQLYCNNNLLSSLLMSPSSVSFELHCDNNLLTGLIPSSPMSNIWCGNNLFTTLDFSNWTGLSFLNCTNSPTLTGLYLKNGRNESVSFDSNANIEFICVDESQLAVIQAMAGNSGIIVSTYCSFTPGGNYNTANGIVRFDYNANGCDTSDVPMSFLSLGINLNTQPTGTIYTNNSGNYALYMSQAGTYALNPNLENPDYFTVSPTVIDATTINNATTVQNICVLPNGIHPDVEVVIAPIVRARPGFDAVYQVVYKNKGNQTLSGNVTFTYNDLLLDFIASDVTPAIQSTGLLTYDYANLLPFENRSIYITLGVNAPTDTPAVNIDDQLHFGASISPVIGDAQAADNEFQFHQTVVGAFDPNDITCIEGNTVSPTEIGNYLHYIINFENTGNAEAENIVVREVINTEQFDVNSLQILNSSALLKAKITGNIAEFVFQNINLHSGGHGNILIKVKSRNTLTEGDSVSKKANIYFDYNFPVETLPENTLFQTLSNPEIPVDASIVVYPNPTTGNVNIHCNTTIKSVQVYDIQGRIVQTDLINQNQTTIDVSAQSNGVYFLKVISDYGMKVEKVVKQ